MASISFKNAVKKEWPPADDEEELTLGPASSAALSSPSANGGAGGGGGGARAGRLEEGEKAAVRGSVLEGLIRAPPLVRSQLAEAFKVMVQADYPERWPGLLEAVVANLQSAEQARRTC